MAAVDSFEFLYREICLTCGFYRDTLALLGALYAASKAVRLLRSCWSSVRVHFVPRLFPGRSLKHRYGAWAVVYGAWEPLGKAYAEELARHSISIIFVTHDEAAIRDSASSLSQRYPVETLVIVADLSLDPGSTIKLVKEALRDRDVGFLINCVDQSLVSSPQKLLSTDEHQLMALVTRNVASATLMTRLVLPGMVERRRGAVVNVSSGYCCQPLPGRVTLAACTGYMEHFSSALQHEYKHRGLFIQSLQPLQVASGSHGWFVPKPETFAHHAVSTLGVSHRTTGYWPHTLQCGLIRWIPEWIWILGSGWFIASS
ncbi:inactive hydroxysteroid dehydrogenase-like protein 1 [Gouania willdenowi]|uniref:Inactive hydroxysteroid dehydrogenase-like protein 1 n=1 Tax=Gouania willdenowi TaxID=441366 RepID=A0A8C5G0A7_GOUWI|nr:inactive hydroxysteroid dehydrogenase-like protein 1 [Gouania willdenowi]